MPSSHRPGFPVLIGQMADFVSRIQGTLGDDFTDLADHSINIGHVAAAQLELAAGSQENYLTVAQGF